ncbi:putative histamine H3 receptor-like [Apostichopus japonicus]|uniref:Putative histamine H3 receptor-like n=1 Tax=Stichopus japonicus TaxID=307972 RepID=A0A2G8K4M3_STIJA|nr:putative histamine H3 receptor-like [Apostichopus japonicus]
MTDRMLLQNLSNETVSTMSSDAGFGEIYTIVTIIVHVCLMVLILFGNALVIVSYTLTKSVRSIPFNRYILLLAIADLIVGIVGLPVFTRIFIWYNVQFSSSWMTLLAWWASRFPVALSVSVVMLMTYDRLRLVTNPFRYHASYSISRVNKSMSYVCIASILHANIYTVLVIVAVAIVAPQQEDNTELERWWRVKIYLDVIEAVANFIIPLTVLAVMNIAFLSKLRVRLQVFQSRPDNMNEVTKNKCQSISLEVDQHNQRTLSTTKSTRQITRFNVAANKSTDEDVLDFSSIIDDKRKSKLRRIARNLFILLLVYLICWMPIHGLLLIQLFGVNQPILLYHVAILLLYSNSAINPLIYAVTSPQYRNGMLRIICPWRMTKVNKAIQANTTPASLPAANMDPIV